MEQGLLTTTISINRNDEFGDLSRAFDRMLQQIVELIRGAELHHELERKLEIQVLQSQINPHFCITRWVLSAMSSGSDKSRK
ncbi:sensor histidine kinase [Paenibacillus rhizoplanae]